ncbi:Protein CBR-GIP-2 [Caenorhabditis briggsae]|uniref:Gamma tubulin complex component protein N-terminal domain-containing protein n=4 Tax=Caenorhabditis briggsae TaxID=6238 RepID=A0AAE9IWY9_CAEBR|nr:Protein CBR-GIP-2 [Caenorhabditis briggsae]ULU09333.1 hypothetical protein L3Y34_014034 [Caenorhabditis briggsae]CAP34763.1 Protein CBR-GIP-2 [Caenorhabditis briggsae]
MRAAAHMEQWREIRKQLLNKFRGVRVCDEPSPLYMSIPTPLPQLHNVLPEEQEEMVFTELKLFLVGHQTENIRIEEFDDHLLPTSIVVNISFDPYIRSQLERFHEILITISTIKICCYAIIHDAVTYSPIGAAVSATIEKKINGFVNHICTKLSALSAETTQPMNNLFREMHKIHESLTFYCGIVKTIYLEQLIGGQVLTLIDSKRRDVFSGHIQDLDDVFQAGWAVFARSIGRLVCKFEADYLNYEFVIWSTKQIDENHRKRLSASQTKHTKSPKYVIIDSLCPKFFLKYLDILVRCAEFGDASKAENSRRMLKKSPGSQENGKESVESVMEDVRNVDWSHLDVNTTIRMLGQFSRKESACLLREITNATNVDQAIRDIHELLIRGSCAHDVMMNALKADILSKPVDEVGNLRMKKLTMDVLGTAAEKHHPFWKYFSFIIDRQNVFDMMGQRTRHGSHTTEPKEAVTPLLFECISVKMDCPIDIEPIISSSAVFTLIPIFRIWLQLHVASFTIANYRDSIRGQMPSRSLGDIATKKHLMHALDAEISNIKQKWTGYVDVAISLYYERVAKAVSLDEYTECQDVLAREVTKMMGITELSHLENIKDILNIIWIYDNDDSNLRDLIADFEEVQSRARMDYVVA